MDSDLEPGNVTTPDISLMGCKTISGAVEGFSAVATEAETLTGVTFTVPAVQSGFLRQCFKPQETEDPLSCDLNEIEETLLGVCGLKRSGKVQLV